MIRAILMGLAGLIRALRRHLITLTLVVGLLALNVATVTLSSVYNTVRNAVWSLLENVPELAQKKPKSVAELEKEAAEAKAAERSAKTETQETKKRLDKSEAEKAELKASESKAKSEATTAKSNAQKLEAEKAELKASESKAKVEAATAKSKARTLEAERADLLESERLAKSEAKAAKAELSAVQDEAKRLKADLDIKTRAATKLDVPVEMSAAQKKRVMGALETLRGRVTRAVQRSVSGEVFEAVPFVGTAVVLGAIAYEANDACMQLRELEELERAIKGTDDGQSTANEGLCLLSPGELYQRITGQDPAYARCVEDRIKLSSLNPPSCAGYPPAVPDIEADTITYAPPTFTLPDIE